MKYLITQSNPASQFIEIDLVLSCKAGEHLVFQLPVWRPGRYELANYAQNIRSFTLFFNQEKVSCAKKAKSTWRFRAKEDGVYTIRYDYYARQMDAGGSWSDPDQLYLNFINIALEVKGREAEPIDLELILPENYRIGTALPQATSKGHRFTAEHFQHLVDSPLIASANLQHLSYTVHQTLFHLWIQGDIHFDADALLDVFSRFTKRQWEAFGSFPTKEYHFLYQLLPYPHYHGVEHKYSTVITYGPADSLKSKSKLDELVGVSSHELYHFWNVCRIRPKALLPYDFSTEAYFEEGVVAEGVTTYFGDMYLLRSGYFSLDKYLEKLSIQLKRELDNQGWKNQSIASSSFDLWLDGYKQGIPDKKVSIYNRGALIALCLDLVLLDAGSSLEEVMQRMWEKFGNLREGYTIADFQKIVSQASGNPEIVAEFFDSYIYGVEDILPEIKKNLMGVGITLDVKPRENALERDYGIMHNEEMQICRIHPRAQAYQKLMLGDKILAVETNAGKTTIRLERNKQVSQVNLEKSKSPFYFDYLLHVSSEANAKREKWIS